MIRYYILPEEEATTPGKGPKYLKWRFDPDPPALVDCKWLGMSYGLIPAMLVVCNLTQAQHDLLSAQSDVAAAPEDIDQNISSGAVPIVQNVLEALRIPAEWVDTSYTYRQILRGVAGLFQFSQRHKGLHGEQVIDTQAQLDLTWSQIPNARRQRVQATADSFGYSYSAVIGSWTVRRTLMHLAQQWGATQFRFFHQSGGIDEWL